MYFRISLKTWLLDGLKAISSFEIQTLNKSKLLDMSCTVALIALPDGSIYCSHRVLNVRFSASLSESNAILSLVELVCISIFYDPTFDHH